MYIQVNLITILPFIITELSHLYKPLSSIFLGICARIERMVNCHSRVGGNPEKEEYSDQLGL